MGQYYKLLNLTKKQYLAPYGGNKLMEHGYCYNNTTTHASNLLMNEWFGDRVIWCGDYVERDAYAKYKIKPIMTDYGIEAIYANALRIWSCVNKSMTRYSDWVDSSTRMRLKGKPEYIVNLTRHQYMLMSKLPKVTTYYRKETNNSKVAYRNIDMESMSKEEIEKILREDKLIKSYDRIMFAPALLLATSNGEGSGDYWNSDSEMCGRWVSEQGDRIGFCTTLEDCITKIPNFNTYTEITPRFKAD